MKRNAGANGAKRREVPERDLAPREPDVLPKRLGGVVPTYTRKVADAVIDTMIGADGGEPMHLTAACRVLGVTPWKVRWWSTRNIDGFRARHREARLLVLEHWADETVTIADDDTEDWTVDAKGNKRVDHEAVGRSRLRIEARQWLLEKLHPHVYGKLAEEARRGDAPTILVIGMQQPRHDPLALPEAGAETVDAGDEEGTTESIVTVSRIMERFGSTPRNGPTGPGA